MTEEVKEAEATETTTAAAPELTVNDLFCT